MKKFSVLACAVVGMLFAACSNNDAVDEGGSGTSSKNVQGYLNVSINLPTQKSSSASTRGWQESDQLSDGLDEEYAVDDLMLIIYGGSTKPEEATVQKIWSPKTIGFKEVEKNQVTSRDSYVVELDKELNGPFYVLAVLNYDGAISVSGTTITAGGKTCAKITDLQKAIATTTTNKPEDSPFINTNGHFFMSNAILSSVEYGLAKNADDVYVLAPVKGIIYDTEDEAKDALRGPSVDIYVERGMAKVTLEASLKLNGISKSTGTLAEPALTGWTLDNTNKKSYVVRNQISLPSAPWGMFSDRAETGANDWFRFIGKTNVDQATEPFTKAWRTYWCADPNYLSDYDAANFYEPAVKSFSSKTGDNYPQYCFENTFDLDHQSYQNTTRVVLGVNLNNGEDFYTLANDRKTIYAESSVKDEAIGRLILNLNFQTWFTANSSATLNKEVVKSVIWSSDTKAGIIRVKDFTIDGTKLTSGTDQSVAALADGKDILSGINTLIGEINRYKGGVAYYSIRIKHFGDDLTPWGKWGESESDIASIYPVTDSDRDNHYLGRYGMVRNNWYLIKVGDVKKIGYPFVPWLDDTEKPGKPDDPTDPDDPKDDNPEDPEHPDDRLDDSFINARINILSWAKRPQSWELK